ncbi:hypothetical protein [Gemmatimonas sp.]|uniref:hypothetical protein n=1 Tax=Gemmatimonas sp. TaxID=1962908 RepID=UPI00286E1D1F|nr:hypothetical protein [Gemmatimonas sp.]
MTRSTFLLVASLTATLTACGESKSAPAVESTAASSTASATDTMKVQGIWSDSVTAESGYLAEYVNGKLVVIEEQMMLADRTRSERAYFYSADFTPTRLFEHRALTAASSNSTPKTLHSLLNIYLTGDKVDSATKQVDFVKKTVQPYEIENMRKHEREIFARVSTTYTAPRTDR